MLGIKRGLVILAIFSSGLARAIAADVSLAWDASISTNIAGYKVYVGTGSRTYGAPRVIGNQTTYTVTGLGPGVYFFAVTAFDASGNESDFSNEVSQQIAPGILPAVLHLSNISLGPIISQVTVAAITSATATVTWKTSADCSGVARWGTDSSSLAGSVTANNLGTTDHLAIVSPLIPRTHYFYRVQSVCNGQTIQSEVGSFNSK